MTVEFGDIEEADTWDDDPTIAPEQVAYRIQKLLREVEFLAGRVVQRWSELTDEQREHVLAVGRTIATNVHAREPDNPAFFAELVHNVRVTREGGPRWAELDGEERQIGIDLLDQIIDWLQKEGPR